MTTTDLPATPDNVSKSFTDWGYYSPLARDSSTSSMGRWLGGIAKGPNTWTKATDQGPLMGGLLGAGVAAPLAFLGTSLYNQFASPAQEFDPTRTTAVAGGLGAALGGLSGWLHKYGAFGGADPLSEATQIISSTYELPPGARSSMLSALPSLSPGELNSLLGLLRTVSGAMLGAMLMRFFMGKGIVSAGIGAAAGGWLAQPQPSSFDSVYG